MTLTIAVDAMQSHREMWPISVSGWVSLVTSIVSLFMIVVGGTIAYGKWLQKLNGLGERVTSIERFRDEEQGKEIERIRTLDGINRDHKQLLIDVGDAKQASIKCGEDAIDHSLELGARVSEVARDVTQFKLDISQRITAVETVIKTDKTG